MIIASILINHDYNNDDNNQLYRRIMRLLCGNYVIMQADLVAFGEKDRSKPRKNGNEAILSSKRPVKISTGTRSIAKYERQLPLNNNLDRTKNRPKSYNNRESEDIPSLKWNLFSSNENLQPSK